ncbi:MAG TPA: hypothetical protein P5119_06220 [Candidatus Aminicenantes bacterium]|nr:hypothetical protein [Candidatus Aminicenantes bacterium]HRY64921.1 hypothetical protein [Candidatus Aminicenantes bacterium]HRZ71834.1 hypothetical protein [Candidatus Aminicenantes bacterium]
MNLSRGLSITVLVLAAALAAVSAEPGQSRKARPKPPDPAAVKALDEMGPELARLEESHGNLMQSVGELEGLYTRLAGKAGEVSKLAAAARKRGAGKEAAKRLDRAAEEMQEMQMSFSIQYLQLQNRIARENRQFSLISNILKDKHGTASGSLKNIR